MPLTRTTPRYLLLAALSVASVAWQSAARQSASPARSYSGRVEEIVAEGLRHISIHRGSVSTTPRFRIVLGSFDSQGRADAMLARAGKAGLAASPHYRSGRYRISVNGFLNQEEAEDKKVLLQAAGFISELAIEEYGQDVTHDDGPWEIHILEASPHAIGVEVVHAYDAAIGLETTSGLARRRGASAAINGGYYLRNGILKGDAVGVLKTNGTLLSEPDRGRAALGLYEEQGSTHALFGRLRFSGELVFADGSRAKLDGVNRRRGTNEVILYTPEFHRTTLTPPGGTEVLVQQGRITEIRKEMGSSVIPRSGFVVSIAPARAVEPLSRLQVGHPLSPELAVVPDDPESQEKWNRAPSIVGGGPLLLEDGRRIEQPELESISQVFFRSRHPRTGVGVRADGTLLFVTVDGRQPQKSVGMSLPELTELFQELGAVSALNLDGGGSTAMVAKRRLVSSPSDPTGERENASAILLFPRPVKPPS
jgi:exopolysaccharide biosynthesis protein